MQVAIKHILQKKSSSSNRAYTETLLETEFFLHFPIFTVLERVKACLMP